jgi:hypothetical protein
MLQRCHTDPKLLLSHAVLILLLYIERYGNIYYVKDNGQDSAVLSAIDAVEICLTPGHAVCRAVPGLGRDQFTACAACGVFGGVVAGAAARTGGKNFNAAWFALFSPLWALFFGSFGLLPVVSREGWASQDTVAVIAAFLITSGAVWAWIPIRFGTGGQDKTTPDV